MTMIKILNTEL